MEVYTSLDNQSYGYKPENSEIPKIKYRTAKNWRYMDLKELAELVGNRGHAMIPAKLEGGISDKDCKAVQLLALDFDKGCSFENIKERCETLEIPIAFAYHSYNSTEQHERFRVVFVYECLIEDGYVRKVIMGMLHKIFPEADHSCMDYSRLFLGGKELIYSDPEACVALVQILTAFHMSLDKNGHFKRDMETFCSNYRILMYNGLPLIARKSALESFGVSMDSTIIHTIGESTKTPFFIAEAGVMLHQSKARAKKHKRLNLEGKTSCELLNDFFNGEDLGHEEKFVIATNLLQINGGKKKFLEVIQRYYMDSFQKWERDLKYMALYHPQACKDTFCPYYGMCSQSGTIVDTLAMDRKVYYKGNKEHYSLEEASEYMYQNIQDAYESCQNGIHLIKAQTALGKTTQYIRLIKENPMQKFIVAVPTNMLKKEVAGRLSTALSKEEVFMTLSVDGNYFIPEEIREKISDYHKRGIHNKTRKLVEDYYKEIKDCPDKQAVEEECRKILDGMDGINGERVVVTTHAYLLQMAYDFLKEYTVIIDEDILLMQMFSRCGQTRLSSIKSALGQCCPEYDRIVNEIIKTESGIYTKIAPAPFEIQLTEEQQEKIVSGTDDNPFDLAYAHVFVKEDGGGSGDPVIRYFYPEKLMPVKYIVLSATLNPLLYKEYFGDDMHVYEYPEKKAAYSGKLKQFTYHSLGRRDLSKKMDVFSYACEEADNEKLEIITFKKLVEHPEHGEIIPLHFGNSSGIDKYKGHDLGIIGTPFSIDASYKLVACYLGADVNSKEDEKPRMRRIEHNDYSFVFMTYSDTLLREIQLYFIESELEQCIGRARLLREECTVYLFSGFPCEQAELHTENYLLNSD